VDYVVLLGLSLSYKCQSMGAEHERSGKRSEAGRKATLA